MKKTVKTLLIAVAVLAALLVAAALYLATTFDPNAYKPRLVQWVKDETGRTLDVPGEIRLTFFPRLGIDLGRIALSEAGSTQTFAGAQRLHVAVALWPLLSRQLVVDRVSLDALELKIRRQRDGRYNFDDLLSHAKDGAPPSSQAGKPAATPADTPALGLDIGGIALTDGSLEYQDDSQQRRLRLSGFNLRTGAIADGRASRFDIDGRIDGNAPALALQFSAQGRFTPALAQGEVALQDLLFKLAGSAAGQRDLKLQLALSSVTASAKAVQAQGLQLELQAPKPAGGAMVLQARGSAQLDLVKEQARLALDGSLDRTTLSLKGSVHPFAQPRIDFDLALGELDADLYLPPSPSPSAKPSTQTAAGPEAVIDLSALRGLNAHGALKIERLKVMNLRAHDVGLRLQAQGGQAQLRELRAALYGGRLAGTLAAAARQPQRLGAQLDLQAIELGPLLKDLLDLQVIDGRGNVTLDVATTGDTVTQFKRALAGQAALQLKDGSLRGINIAGALRQAQARLGGGAQVTSSSQAEKTDFTELTASLRIKDGVAHNDDLSAKTPLLRLGGAGDVFIAEDRLDYTVKATVVPTLQGQGGPELQQLKGLTVPVRLSGPYKDLHWKIDLGAGASQRAQQAAEQRRDQVRDQAREAAQQRLEQEKAGLEQRLKGLLGR